LNRTTQSAESIAPPKLPPPYVSLGITTAQVPQNTGLCRTEVSDLAYTSFTEIWESPEDCARSIVTTAVHAETANSVARPSTTHRVALLASGYGSRPEPVPSKGAPSDMTREE
jgi:hypothetical protein